ncbi:protein CONSERVED IN THE GREEN LINEAGE AND DIATOMS 27, chloroplastic-like isoform X2 [Phragmites australis]|uniref:protein CONSERVED IN THE GREEN LINEAGE AND DIATOMS 27, chloroplastic-like isoform X2 n=1 Tax=Phragmites australis TaxID=29695 RepID=UPI002D776D45|nr:protein CONSERVED IN THE GREEN LINEAGE AND DIATOMS 27, chloroplastic-like isoform X2 [Phragmites australis]
MAAASLSPPLHARLLPLLPNRSPCPNPAAPASPASGARRSPQGRRRFATPPSRNGRSPETEWCPVPPEQRPVNEYEALAASLPFSWAAGDLRVYCSRLALTGAAFALFVGLPVAAFGGRGGTGGDSLHLALGATGSGILAVTLAVVRMYLGWAYVGNRLLSATVEYEETGWYDGQIWVKTPEVLARDRLLGSFSEPYDNNGGRAIPGVYSDTAARSFEPDAFCGEPDLS